jgi:hypothetical protein
VQLKDGEFASHIALLELFCYGTWSDYKGSCLLGPHASRGSGAGRHTLTLCWCSSCYAAHQASLPQLNTSQQNKLKQLTLVQLATTDRVSKASSCLACRAALQPHQYAWWAGCVCAVPVESRTEFCRPAADMPHSCHSQVATRAQTAQQPPRPKPASGCAAPECCACTPGSSPCCPHLSCSPPGNFAPLLLFPGLFTPHTRPSPSPSSPPPLQVLPYSTIQHHLDIPADIRQLEDFIITECFYTGECPGVCGSTGGIRGWAGGRVYQLVGVAPPRPLSLPHQMIYGHRLYSCSSASSACSPPRSLQTYTTRTPPPPTHTHTHPPRPHTGQAGPGGGGAHHPRRPPARRAPGAPAAAGCRTRHLVGGRQGLLQGARAGAQGGRAQVWMLADVPGWVMVMRGQDGMTGKSLIVSTPCAVARHDFHLCRPGAGSGIPQLFRR